VRSTPHISLRTRTHEETEKVVEEGCEKWRQLRYRDVLAPILSIAELGTVGRLAINLAFGDVAPYSLLDPAPLAETLRRLVKFTDIHKNVTNPDAVLRACAVVATAADTNRSVVFHDGGRNPASDERRGIDFFPTEVTEDQARASAAIPIAFPAVEVGEPTEAKGWFFDGGTRLNTPIKPALELGVECVIVIGLNSLSAAPRSGRRPDLFDGASQIVQALLEDRVVHDVETLATINETLIDGGIATSGKDEHKVVPYIFVAPPTPNRIGEIARDVYRDHYTGPSGARRSIDLALLGRFVGAGRGSTRGELFSYFFFAPEFATRLIELGRHDATLWTEQTHDHGAWQLRAL
jgi:NTE family protein